MDNMDEIVLDLVKVAGRIKGIKREMEKNNSLDRQDYLELQLKNLIEWQDHNINMLTREVENEQAKNK